MGQSGWTPAQVHCNQAAQLGHGQHEHRNPVGHHLSSVSGRDAIRGRTFPGEAGLRSGPPC